MQKIYKIHEVAERLGMSPSAIRLRERRGEFPPPRRTDKGWRYYTEEDVIKLEAYFITGRRKKYSRRKVGT